MGCPRPSPRDATRAARCGTPARGWGISAVNRPSAVVTAVSPLATRSVERIHVRRPAAIVDEAAGDDHGGLIGRTLEHRAPSPWR